MGTLPQGTTDTISCIVMVFAMASWSNKGSPGTVSCLELVILQNEIYKQQYQSVRPASEFRATFGARGDRHAMAGDAHIDNACTRPDNFSH